jgi:hypothetical protein
MPDITTPLAVRTANEKLRPFGDVMLEHYYTARAFQQYWVANGLDAIIPATTDLIADGSDVDGRPRITANQMRQAKARADTIVAEHEANTNAVLNVMLKIGVNGRSRI